MATVETIWLQREHENIPWGFRLLGGRDFQQPLSVQKVSAGSIAATGLSAGDVINRIGETETDPLTHAQSMLTIKNCGNTLQLGIIKGGAPVMPTPTGTPQSTPVRVSTVQPSFTSQGGGENIDSSSYPFGAPQFTGPQTPTAGGIGSPGGYRQDGHPGFGSPPITNGGRSPGGGGGYQDQYPEDSTLDGYQAADTQSYSGMNGSRQQQQKIPDAVLNMAAKGSADKKPFSYVADVNAIREQRERVRKKAPVSAMPRYQQMLNMPQFEEPAPARSRGLLHRSVSATPPPPSDTAVVANLQFNTPLGLYSGDNVVEALKGQTGSHVTEVIGLPKKDKGDITQSAVYKMIHGIDQPKPKAAIVYAEAHDSPLRQRSMSGGGDEAPDADLRLAGLNKPVNVPSRSFQMLQQSVGDTSPGVDTSSIRHNDAGDDAGVGQYDEKSIRYTGKNIPSKSFRMLQTMTGGQQPQIVHAGMRPTPRRDLSPDDETRFSGLNHVQQLIPPPIHAMQQMGMDDSLTATQRGGSEIDTSSFRHHLLPPGSEDSGQYDEASLRYTGKSIPSRSFRLLQSMTGGDMSDTDVVPPVRRQQRRPPPHHAQPQQQQHQQQHQQQYQQQHPQQQQQIYRQTNATPTLPGSGEEEERSGRAGSNPPPAGGAEDGRPAKDIRYVGSSVPSSTFKMIQNAYGAHDSADLSASEADTLQSTQGRRVKVVRLRTQASIEDKSAGSTEF